MIFTTCRKTQIRMVRGATHTLLLQVFGPDGQPYVPLEGDVIRFGVKYDENAESCMVKKQVAALVDGCAIIRIFPEDTIGMETGEYKYDIGLQSEGQYFPVIRFSDFILEPNITWKE